MFGFWLFPLLSTPDNYIVITTPVYCSWLRKQFCFGGVEDSEPLGPCQPQFPTLLCHYLLDWILYKWWLAPTHHHPTITITRILLFLFHPLGRPVFWEYYYFVSLTSCHLIHDNTHMTLSVTYMPCHYHTWIVDAQPKETFILCSLLPGPSEPMIISSSCFLSIL